MTVDAGGVTTTASTTGSNGALGFDTGGYSLTGGTITVLSTGNDSNVVVVRGGTTTNIANNIAITPFKDVGTTGDFIRLVHQRVNSSHVTFGGNIGMAAGVTSGVQRLDFISGGGATNTQSTLNGVISNYLGAGTGATLQLRVGVNGAGTSPIVNLNGNNTFTGGVIVGDGIVNVGHNNALGTAAFAFGTGGIGAGSVGQLLTSSALTISNAIGVSNQANQAGVIIGVGGAHSSTFSGTITNDSTANSTALTLRAASGGTANFSGLITDGVATKNVVKDGSGTVVLSRAAGNTYDGTTTVSAGTLLVNNTSGSATGTGAVSVSSGATLGGTGIIAGATTINSGAIHTAGTSNTLATPSATLGKETFTTGITYNSSSIFEWNLTANTDSSTGTRASNYDAVNTASLGGNDAIFRVVLNNSQNFSESFWNTSRTWTDIFTNVAGDTSLSIAAIFSRGIEYYNSAGLVTGVPSTQGSFSFTGTTLNWTAVPEPSSALAGLLIGAGLLRRRRTV